MEAGDRVAAFPPPHEWVPLVRLQPADTPTLVRTFARGRRCVGSCLATALVVCTHRANDVLLEVVEPFHGVGPPLVVALVVRISHSVIASHLPCLRTQVDP